MIEHDRFSFVHMQGVRAPVRSLPRAALVLR
jgi:hypothetical protein